MPPVIPAITREINIKGIFLVIIPIANSTYESAVHTIEIINTGLRPNLSEICPKIGNYFAYVGIMIVLAQGLIVRKAANYLKDYQALRFSMFGTATCLLVYYFIPASHTYLVYWIPPFMAAFNALTMSFNASLVTRVTAVNMRGEALGINSSVMAIAQVFPAILSGYVASIESSLPIMVGSLTVYIGGILFWLLFNPRTHTPQIAK